MRRKLFLAVLLVLVLLPSTVLADNSVQVEKWWQSMIEQEEKPLVFTQTVITMFPGRTAVTVDQVKRGSSIKWSVKRSSDLHGTLIFNSGNYGFRAFAKEEGIVFEDSSPRILNKVLHPTFQSDEQCLDFVDRFIWRGVDTVTLERKIRDKGIVRYWIDVESHRLLKEESLDESGKVIYILLRGGFEELTKSDWDELDQMALGLKNIGYAFNDEQIWWQEVLLSGLKKRHRNALIPRRLPPGTHLVAAQKGQDGTITLRYFDGSRVFSIFQKMAPHRVKEKFVGGNPSVFTTTRRGVMITIVGPLQKQEMADIVDSLEDITKGD